MAQIFLQKVLLLLSSTTLLVNAFSVDGVSCNRNLAVLGTSHSSLYATAESTGFQKSNEELLSLLLKKAKPDIVTSSDDIKRIEYLMDVLQNQNSFFDPKICLYGPLFAALHQTGPQPFWEKYDINLPFGNGKKNIKGQRYTLNEEGNYDVFNYAEFLGENVSAQGVGVCQKNTNESLREGGGENNNVNEGNIFSNLFKSSNSNSDTVKCPADYTIQVTGASLNILKKSLDFKIQGTGYLRVLYADENLRIFTTPKNTASSGNMIDEKAGLTVVQVRVDLIDPTFTIE